MHLHKSQPGTRASISTTASALPLPLTSPIGQLVNRLIDVYPGPSKTPFADAAGMMMPLNWMTGKGMMPHSLHRPTAPDAILTNRASKCRAESRRSGGWNPQLLTWRCSFCLLPTLHGHSGWRRMLGGHVLMCRLSVIVTLKAIVLGGIVMLLLRALVVL